jgi:hypothetical protein
MHSPFSLYISKISTNFLTTQKAEEDAPSRQNMESLKWGETGITDVVHSGRQRSFVPAQKNAKKGLLYPYNRDNNSLLMNYQLHRLGEAYKESNPRNYLKARNQTSF